MVAVYVYMYMCVPPTLQYHLYVQDIGTLCSCVYICSYRSRGALQRCEGVLYTVLFLLHLIL